MRVKKIQGTMHEKHIKIRILGWVVESKLITFQCIEHQPSFFTLKKRRFSSKLNESPLSAADFIGSPTGT